MDESPSLHRENRKMNVQHDGEGQASGSQQHPTTLSSGGRAVQATSEPAPLAPSTEQARPLTASVGTRRSPRLHSSSHMAGSSADLGGRRGVLPVGKTNASLGMAAPVAPGVQLLRATTSRTAVVATPRESPENRLEESLPSRSTGGAGADCSTSSDDSECTPSSSRPRR